MHLDQFSAVVDPHQVAAVAHLDALADVLCRYGVQRLGHRQVVIALHPDLAPRRHLVGDLRSREQEWPLFTCKMLCRPLPGRAVNPPAGGHPAPALSCDLRFGQRGKRLARE
jgi:hypothetical protein